MGSKSVLWVSWDLKQFQEAEHEIEQSLQLQVVNTSDPKSSQTSRVPVCMREAQRLTPNVTRCQGFEMH